MPGTPTVKGYLREKGGKYHTLLEYTDECGKKQRQWRATGLTTKRGNKGPANDMLAQRKQAMIEELKRKRLPPTAVDMRYSDWVQLWLAESKERVDEITYQGYELNVNNHIVPYFDEHGTTLGELTLG